jgi:hypothetical protein
MGSAGELEYYVILAADLKLLSDATGTQLAAEAAEVKRVLSGLLTAVLRNNESSKPKLTTEN